MNCAFLLCDKSNITKTATITPDVFCISIIPFMIQNWISSLQTFYRRHQGRHPRLQVQEVVFRYGFFRFMEGDYSINNFLFVNCMNKSAFSFFAVYGLHDNLCTFSRAEERQKKSL